MTWYAPTEKAPAKPTTVLVIPKTGPAVCGALKSTRAGQLTVKPKQGPAAVVPTADVIDLSSVTTCP